MGGYYNFEAVRAHLRAQSISPASCFRYNPYDSNCPVQEQYIYEPVSPVHPYSRQNAPSPTAEYGASLELPAGTLHTALTGRVSFIPYPVEEFHVPEAPLGKDQMVRVFIGQLPYQVSDMQLNWLCYTFGQGSLVYYPERITKHDAARGCKMPTGCIHAYCDPQTADNLLNNLHKKILVDDTGVWFAEDENQLLVLADYCQTMKLDRTRRFQNRPYDTVVAQYATSSYVPSKRRNHAW